MDPAQVALDKRLGPLAVGAEKDRDTEVDDDGHDRAEHGVGVRSGAVRSREDVAQVGLDDDAGGLIPRQTLELGAEPLPGTNDGSDEVFECLALDRHLVLPSIQRVIPGGQGPARGRHTFGIEGVRLLLPRIDDNRDPIRLRTVRAHPGPPFRAPLARPRS